MGSIKCNFEKFVWYTYSLFHRHFFFVVQVGGLESLRLLKTDVTLRGNCDAYGPSYEFNYMISRWGRHRDLSCAEGLRNRSFLLFYLHKAVGLFQLDAEYCRVPTSTYNDYNHGEAYNDRND